MGVGTLRRPKLSVLEFSLVNKKVAVGEGSVCSCCCAPNHSTDYLTFLESLGGKTLRSVIGRNGLFDLNWSDFLLDFCTSHGMAITNTMFKRKMVHECTWLPDRLQSKVNDRLSCWCHLICDHLF